MTVTEDSPDAKYVRLLDALRQAGDSLLAFSGGVDSSFLLAAMKGSGIKAVAVTGRSDTTPKKDIEDACALAESLGIRHIMIETEEMLDESFVSNPPDRCFYCKDELFGKISAISSELGIVSVFDGSNADDLGDHRPGLRAAGKHGIRSPLAECGMTKNDIRALSKKLGLQTWNKPSSPCLSSRFPYGTRITQPALRRVAAAEDFIRNLGFHEFRVRDHGDVARLEISASEISMFLDEEIRLKVSGALKAIGYVFVSLDLDGFKSGSLNKSLVSSSR